MQPTTKNNHPGLECSDAPDNLRGALIALIDNMTNEEKLRFLEMIKSSRCER